MALDDSANTPGGNLSGALDALLSHFKIARASSQDALETAIIEHLESKHLSASIHEIRNQTLTLHADATNAALLAYETDQLSLVAERVAPGCITSVRIRVRG